MIKLTLDFIQFLLSNFQLITSVALFTLVSVLLAKTVKKHPKLCYSLAAIPFVLVAVPVIGRWVGLDIPSLTRVPVLGEILRDYIHMGTLGHPLLIIIMYMGALDPKIPFVKKLMSIRKEISIISGFPVLTHSLIRVSNNFPRALRYFTDHEEYLADNNVVSDLGAGLNNFSWVLGVVMLALFLVLWVTSFDAVHKKMGGARWKRLQKWSYGLYAMLFIHAMCMQVGGLITSKASAKQRAATETVAENSIRGEGRRSGATGTPETAPNGGSQSLTAVTAVELQSASQNTADARTLRTDAGTAGDAREAQATMQDGSERSSAQADASREPAQASRQGGGRQHGEGTAVQGSGGGQQPAARPSGGGRAPVKGFDDFRISGDAKRYVNIASLLLVYGSYLWLRVRKARRNKRRKAGIVIK